MKHILAIVLGFLCVLGIYFFIQYSSEPLSFTVEKPTNTPTPIPHKIVQGPKEQLLFVPYWGLTNQKLPSTYTQLIYFGIVPDAKGIDTTDVGYKNISLFIRRVPSRSKTLLTVRLIDPTINEKILQDKTLQQTVIEQAIAIAKENNFSGIALDFEYNALAFDSVINNISLFSTNFSQYVHESNLAFYQLLYGDTFYRLRPYDVEKIGKSTDGIIVMAYDFHKANGDVGPNFPLSGRETQGYDFKTMVDDFVQHVPSQKLIVAFGLYGYDWIIDSSGHSQAPATALSLLQIQQKFLVACTFSACHIVRDPTSSETKIEYTNGQDKHIVWFDDMVSVAQKSAYLHSQGINATALWAYSYF